MNSMSDGARSGDVRHTAAKGGSRFFFAWQSLADDAEPFHAELERRLEHLALARVNRRNTS